MTLKATRLLFLFFFIVYSALGQLHFNVSIDTSSINVMPGLHSGAIAEYNGKWIFIGGRTNGLHGFQPVNGFPLQSINDQIYMIDATANALYQQGTSMFDTTLMEVLQSSAHQYVQRDSMLYMVGGYGVNWTLSEYITQPHLVAVNLNILENALANSTNAEPAFRIITDTFFAVCGGNMYATDSLMHIVFGHRFDGRYSENDSSGIYQQQYTNAIRTFVLHDDGINLSISDTSTVIDSINFHRRDFNLVPQKFPDGSLGYTAFTGVFKAEARMPYLDCINIYADNSYEVIPNFNQNLNQYATAFMPVYDVANKIMQTVFFGGTGLYTFDANTQQLVLDTLIPFVKTISKVVRYDDSTMQEFALPDSMPSYLGTNATFFFMPGIPLIDGRFLDINNIVGATKVGYIVGGIESPDPNISTSGVFVSSAVSTVFEVWIDPSSTGYINNGIDNSILNLMCYPNPNKGMAVVEFTTVENQPMHVQVTDNKGRVVRTIFSGKLEPGKHKFEFSCEELLGAMYFVTVNGQKATKSVKVLRNSH